MTGKIPGYGNGNKIETLTWHDFMQTVKNEQWASKHPNSFEKFNVFPIRCFLIRKVKELFTSQPRFSGMNPDDRKFIAGIPNELDKPEMRAMLKNAGKIAVESRGKARYRYETSTRLLPPGTYIGTWFGNMGASGIFKQKICENSENVSRALDQIPLSGEVTKQHYLNFWEHYGKEFSKTSIATATRLLCMKRPDVFICFDSANKKNLCTEFRLSVSKSYDKDDYWEDILSRIYKSDWYKTQKTHFEDEEEKLVYGARVAFLDAVYYELTEGNENKTRGKDGEGVSA